MSQEHDPRAEELKPFFIGTTDIYDYQVEGFKRWGTFQAAETSVIRESALSLDLFRASGHAALLEEIV